MLSFEELIKQFTFGISVLTAYLSYNDKLNLHDIHIISENFIMDLMNILYGMNLHIPVISNSPGYDLISERDKLVVQVSVSCHPDKVKKTFSAINGRLQKIKEDVDELDSKILKMKQTIGIATEKLKKCDSIVSQNDLIYYRNQLEELTKKRNRIEDIRGFKIMILFLSDRADNVINFKNGMGFNEYIPDGMSFSQSHNVLCLSSLLKKLRSLSQDANKGELRRIEKLMTQVPFFVTKSSLMQRESQVEKIINEYAKNFTSPLFFHQYEVNTRVTLKNLYVEPELSPIVASPYNSGPSKIVSLLDFFLWDSEKDRILFLDGDAAIGKTSLISWLCFHYCEREYDDIGKSIFLNSGLVCIRLRDLDYSTSTGAESCILNYLSIEDMDSFERQYSKSLIVLEGADELGIVNRADASSIEQFILDVRHSFSNHKILVTSRPKFISMESVSKNALSFSYLHYSLDHFTAEKRAEWLANFESKEKCGQVIPPSTKKYLSEMDDEAAAGVADTPLGLYLLAISDITDDLKRNRWALYHKIFHDAIRNTPYNESFHSSSRHPALQDDRFASAVYNTIGEISNRMYINSKKEQFCIYSDELDDIVSRSSFYQNETQKNAIQKCCVLCAYWKKGTNTGALEFYHNNIRAFFMCEYLYRRFSGISFFSMTRESIQLLIQTACETLQHTLFAGTTWVQAFSFLYFRVQFEMENGLSKINLVSIDERLTLYFSALDEVINGKTIWTYNYCELPYDSIKITFFNTVLFLRIWLSLDGFSKMTAGSGIKFLSMWNKSELLRDWSDIFSRYVEITPTKHIGFGTQMIFEDLTFDGINLTYACFEGSTFVNCVFNNVRLCNAIFSSATLKNVRFNECDLSHAEFSNASINDVDFTSSCLNNAILIQSSIVDAKWPKNTSNFSNLVFDKSEIARTAWRGSSIKTHSLSEVKFTECSFQSISFPPILNGATFFNCSQKNSVFCTVNGLTFLGDSLVHTSVKFMKSINNCCFNGNTIDSFDCTRAIIDNVRFINVRLGDFSLRGATIKKFNFENCTVKGNIDATGATFGNAERAMLQSLTKNVTFH